MRNITIDEILLKPLSATVRQQLQRLKAGAVASPGIPGQIAHMESPTGHAPLGPKKVAGYCGPTRIVIVERRHRLTDYGGGSEKYLVDALVSAGVLQDDRLSIVRKIEKEQVKIPKEQDEETIVEIWKEDQ
jgi:hypothetical protein